jgi:hypothetical protein
MNNTRHTLLLFALFAISGLTRNICSQQDPSKPTLNKGSIESGFTYVIRNASDYEDSKVVKSWWLWTLRAYVLDSLKVYRDSIQGFQNLVEVRELQIDSLQTDIKQLNASLSDAIKERDSLSLLGISISKVAYNAVMWLLAAILFTAFLIVFLMFRRSNVVTVKTRATLTETQEEFEAHRKRALEREQKIAREMYDEVIKYKNKYGEL